MTTVLIIIGVAIVILIFFVLMLSIMAGRTDRELDRIEEKARQAKKTAAAQKADARQSWDDPRM